MKQPATKTPPNKVETHLYVRDFPPDLPNTTWLTIDEVLRYVPVSRAVWYRGVRSGAFPRQHKVGRSSFWTARDIRALLDLGPKRNRRITSRAAPQDPSSKGDVN